MDWDLKTKNGAYPCCHLISVNYWKWIALMLKVKESILLHFMSKGDSKFVKCLPEKGGGVPGWSSNKVNKHAYVSVDLVI